SQPIAPPAAPREAKAQDAAKPPELMTPDEYQAANPGYAGIQFRRQDYASEESALIEWRKEWAKKYPGITPVIEKVNDRIVGGPRYKMRAKISPLDRHANDVRAAVAESKPVTASAVDAYGIKLPSGYGREGDLYVFKGGQKPAEMRPSNFRLTDNYFTDPRLRTNKRWAWRAMGAKEYAKLMSGEKVYGAGAGKGQFFSPTPDGARQYGEAQNKYLVEFDGVEATGEGISGTASKSNVVRAWRYTNGEWKPIRIDAAKPEMVPTSARADDAPVSPSPAEPAAPVARMTKNDLLAELRAAGVADRDLRGKDRAALAKYAESVRAGGEVAPVQASAAKESWQMTRAEYARGAKVRRDMKRNYVIITGPDGKEVITRTLEPGQPEKGLIEGAHRIEISEALAAGKPVPAAVLADYPDLKPAVVEKPKAQPSGLAVPSVEGRGDKYADWKNKEQIMALAPAGSRSAGRLSNALKAAGVPHQFGPPRTLGSKRSSVKIPNTQEAINIVRRMGGTIVKDQPHWLTEDKEPYEQKPTTP
ncbi:MAG TPA: hypothetical protein PLD73_19230, partial [Candidatus Hydrogenedentes bacterium]|nr:hypothetical protein [Candidatus Hydrogenedentota bacterium]